MLWGQWRAGRVPAKALLFCVTVLADALLICYPDTIYEQMKQMAAFHRKIRIKLCLPSLVPKKVVRNVMHAISDPWIYSNEISYTFFSTIILLQDCFQSLLLKWIENTLKDFCKQASCLITYYGILKTGGGIAAEIFVKKYIVKKINYCLNSTYWIYFFYFFFNIGSHNCTCTSAWDRVDSIPAHAAVGRCSPKS